MVRLTSETDSEMAYIKQKQVGKKSRSSHCRVPQRVELTNTREKTNYMRKKSQKESQTISTLIMEAEGKSNYII